MTATVRTLVPRFAILGAAMAIGIALFLPTGPLAAEPDAQAPSPAAPTPTPIPTEIRLETASPGVDAVAGSQESGGIGGDRYPWWDVLQAFGTVAVAFAAVYAAFITLRQYVDQRRRDASLDLAKLQGDLVALLRVSCERAKGTVDHVILLEELREAEDVYEGVLRGIVTARPELARAAQEALMEYMQVATSMVDNLRDDEGG